jgi:glucokinase
MSARAAGAVWLGVDLGGTGTRVVALSDAGEILAESVTATWSTPVGNGSSPVERLIQLLRDVAGPWPIRGVGIGASGPIDREGIVRNRDTLALFSDIPLVATVADRLGVPCAIDSDAVTFSLGEYRLGAGRGARALLGVTLGTGIGACALDEGRPYRGGDGLHPELGHIPVPGGPAPCYCGLASCWEQLASRTALEKHVAAAGFANAEAASAAASAGDDVARELFEHYGQAVGAGLAALCTVFRPDRVVIGGGASAYLDLFFGGLSAALGRNAPYETTRDIRRAELAAVAGAIGAATLIQLPAAAT